MDKAIEEVTTVLKGKGMFDDTFLVFTSDNG
jgi:arylsulfatase A-like enzyme